VQRLYIPPAVAEELAIGRKRGIALPDPANLEWVEVQGPASHPVLPLVTDLGAGKTEVLALALEHTGALVIIDDAPARRVAEALGIKLTGTLGLLIDAKRAGLIFAVAPVLDQLQTLRFRVAPHTRRTVLKLSGEAP
jgi:predicted nucleic acid-binding protein